MAERRYRFHTTRSDPASRHELLGMRRRKVDPGEERRREEAIAWFAALRSGEISAEDRIAYDTWRANPENQASMDAVREMWGELSVLKHVNASKRSRGPSWSMLGAIAAAAAFSIALVWFWSGRADDRLIATSVGQQRTQSLPDGSLVAVNVVSSLSYEIDDDTRLVKLSQGEAAFTVKGGRSAPFVVQVGQYEVRAVGTQFNVRRRGEEIEVAVAEGAVEICAISGMDAGDLLATISAGQLLRLPTFKPLDAIELAQPSTISPDEVSGWRSHIVTYEDASVREVVEDLNRYFERKLVVEKPDLLNMRVTIRLQVEDREKAIRTLAGLLSAGIRNSESADYLED